MILDAEIRWYEKRLRTAQSEHRDFIDCVKMGKNTMITPEIGHRTATILHMGNISMLLDRALTWDPKNESFVNDTEANELRSRESRAPWGLEDILIV
jgi:hypothetical protein